MPRAFSLLLLAASCALAQGGGGAGSRSPAPSVPPAGPGVYRVGGGVTAPMLIAKVEPQYSDEARQAKYQGAVLLFVEVDPNGNPTNIQVRRSLGLGLDEKAVEAVRQWKFKPGTKDGVPVTVAASIEVNFRLLSHWSVAWQSYNTDAGVTKPVLRGSAFPPDCKSTAQVTVAVDIGSDGSVQNVRTVESSEPAVEQSVLDTVRRWQFVPAQYQGAPEPAGGQIQLACRP